MVVDHALQAGSEAVASRASRQAAELGLDPVTVRRVTVGSDGGPEGAAREARHASIAEVAADTGSPLVLFGHTLDDQAETVLLGLLRGSGPDSLSGMPPLARRDAGPAYGRPLLAVRRHTTRQACAAAGLAPWHDPQNDDPAFTRVRVRNAADARARTGARCRRRRGPGPHGRPAARGLGGARPLRRGDGRGPRRALRGRHLAVGAGSSQANPPALRQRLVRLAVESEFGVTLSRVQTLEVCRLVTDWNGQGPIDLPGVRVSRDGDRLSFIGRRRAG